MSEITLSGIYVYPVKGCRGIPRATGVVTSTGLKFDRNWVVVRAESGKFLTQRQKPALALVEVQVVPEGLLDGADLAGYPDAKLVLRAPGMPELQVPLTADAAAGKALVPVAVWDWSGQAADEGDAAADWFSGYLGQPCRLLRYAGAAGAAGAPSEDPARRQVERAWAPAGAETAFADGFPFLLASEASLDALNSHLAAKGEPALPINRFRPNLVVSGAAPFEEDCWSSLAVGDPSASQDSLVAFDSVKPCTRCKVTTINQSTGEEGLEPLVSLRETRSGKLLGWDKVPGLTGGAVFFATNLLARQRGVVRLGDRVTITARREGAPMPLAA